MRLSGEAAIPLNELELFVFVKSSQVPLQTVVAPQYYREQNKCAPKEVRILLPGNRAGWAVRMKILLTRLLLLVWFGTLALAEEVRRVCGIRDDA